MRRQSSRKTLVKEARRRNKQYSKALAVVTSAKGKEGAKALRELRDRGSCKELILAAKDFIAGKKVSKPVAKKSAPTKAPTSAAPSKTTKPAEINPAKERQLAFLEQLVSKTNKNRRIAKAKAFDEAFNAKKKAERNAARLSKQVDIEAMRKAKAERMAEYKRKNEQAREARRLKREELQNLLDSADVVIKVLEAPTDKPMTLAAFLDVQGVDEVESARVVLAVEERGCKPLQGERPFVYWARELAKLGTGVCPDAQYLKEVQIMRGIHDLKVLHGNAVLRTCYKTRANERPSFKLSSEAINWLIDNNLAEVRDGSHSASLRNVVTNELQSVNGHHIAHFMTPDFFANSLAPFGVYEKQQREELAVATVGGYAVAGGVFSSPLWPYLTCLDNNADMHARLSSMFVQHVTTARANRVAVYVANLSDKAAIHKLCSIKRGKGFIIANPEEFRKIANGTNEIDGSGFVGSWVHAYGDSAQLRLQARLKPGSAEAIETINKQYAEMVGEDADFAAYNRAAADMIPAMKEFRQKFCEADGPMYVKGLFRNVPGMVAPRVIIIDANQIKGANKKEIKEILRANGGVYRVQADMSIGTMANNGCGTTSIGRQALNYAKRRFRGKEVFEKALQRNYAAVEAMIKRLDAGDIEAWKTICGDSWKVKRQLRNHFHMIRKVATDIAHYVCKNRGNLIFKGMADVGMTKPASGYLCDRALFATLEEGEWVDTASRFYKGAMADQKELIQFHKGIINLPECWSDEDGHHKLFLILRHPVGGPQYVQVIVSENPAHYTKRTGQVLDRGMHLHTELIKNLLEGDSDGDTSGAMPLDISFELEGDTITFTDEAQEDYAVAWSFMSKDCLKTPKGIEEVQDCLEDGSETIPSIFMGTGSEYYSLSERLVGGTELVQSTCLRIVRAVSEGMEFPCINAQLMSVINTVAVYGGALMILATDLRKNPHYNDRIYRLLCQLGLIRALFSQRDIRRFLPEDFVSQWAGRLSKQIEAATVGQLAYVFDSTTRLSDMFPKFDKSLVYASDDAAWGIMRPSGFQDALAYVCETHTTFASKIKEEVVGWLTYVNFNDEPHKLEALNYAHEAPHWSEVFNEDPRIVLSAERKADMRRICTLSYTKDVLNFKFSAFKREVGIYGNAVLETLKEDCWPESGAEALLWYAAVNLCMGHEAFARDFFENCMAKDFSVEQYMNSNTSDSLAFVLRNSPGSLAARVQAEVDFLDESSTMLHLAGDGPIVNDPEILNLIKLKFKRLNHLTEEFRMPISQELSSIKENFDWVDRLACWKLGSEKLDWRGKVTNDYIRDGVYPREYCGSLSTPRSVLLSMGYNAIEENSIGFAQWTPEGDGQGQYKGATAYCAKGTLVGSKVLCTAKLVEILDISGNRPAIKMAHQTKRMASHVVELYSDATGELVGVIANDAPIKALAASCHKVMIEVGHNFGQKLDKRNKAGAFAQQVLEVNDWDRCLVKLTVYNRDAFAFKDRIKFTKAEDKATCLQELGFVESDSSWSKVYNKQDHVLVVVPKASWSCLQSDFDLPSEPEFDPHHDELKAKMEELDNGEICSNAEVAEVLDGCDIDELIDNASSEEPEIIALVQSISSVSEVLTREQRIAKAKDMRSSGVPVKDIAAELHMSRSTIYKWTKGVKEEQQLKLIEIAP